MTQMRMSLKLPLPLMCQEATVRAARPPYCPGKRLRGNTTRQVRQTYTDIGRREKEKEVRKEQGTEEEDDTVTTVELTDAEPEVYFGDAVSKLAAGEFRLALLNLSNPPLTADDGKNGLLFNLIIEQDIDILLMQEVGLRWDMIKNRNNWRTRIDETFERNTARTKFSYNIHDDTRSEQQWGGTGVFTQGKLKHYAI